MGNYEVKPEAELKTLFYIYSWPLLVPPVALAAVMIFVPLDMPAIIILPLLFVFSLALLIFTALWIPAFCRSLEYSIDDDAVRCNSGVFWKKRVTVPYSKITNVDIAQGPVQRAYGVGTVHVQTAGASAAQGGIAELSFVGIRDLDGVRDAIMSRVGTPSAARVLPPPAAPAEEKGTQQLMLEELRAIRAALEEKRR